MDFLRMPSTPSKDRGALPFPPVPSLSLSASDSLIGAKRAMDAPPGGTPRSQKRTAQRPENDVSLFSPGLNKQSHTYTHIHNNAHATSNNANTVNIHVHSTHTVSNIEQSSRKSFLHSTASSPTPLSAKKTHTHTAAASSSAVKSNTASATTVSALQILRSPVAKHDRFIPNRSAVDVDHNHYLLAKAERERELSLRSGEDAQSTSTANNNLLLTPSQRRFNTELTNSLMKSPDGRQSLMNCRQPTQDAPHTPSAAIFSFSSPQASRTLGETRFTPHTADKRIKNKEPRVFPSAPSKVLDAPNLVNDYYLNLLSWSAQDVLAVSLADSIYLYHPKDSHIDQLLSLEEEDESEEAPERESRYVSSVSFSPGGDFLAVGTSFNTVQLWDVREKKMVREMLGHSNRVSSLSWQNDRTLSSGGRDSMIITHDYRARRSAVSYHTGHTQEVCGLAWSPDESTLASGANDNTLCLWDPAMSGPREGGLSQQSFGPRLSLDQHHTAAVKALAWCPWQRHVLASGGGTMDRTIRLWNTVSGSNTRCVDTGSQVCALQWSEPHKELISSHGFSDYQLIIWRYKDMFRLHELRGHTARVLHMAKSPCGSRICSASADETLRFWDIFPASSQKERSFSSPTLLSPRRGGTAMLKSPACSMIVR